MKMVVIKRYILMIGFIWSLVCSIALFAHLREDYRQTVNRLQTRAVTMLERDVLYRDWVSAHGGVYVPITETSQPNPHLEFLPGRDIVTNENNHLTLVNPSFLTSQIFALDNRSGHTISKITSRDFLSQENAPDEWERTALLRLEKGQDVVNDISEINGQSFLRVMRPLYVEETCIKCHAEQGYSVGDIRGGLSVAVPFDPSFQTLILHNLKSLSLFLVLWFVGLVGIVLLGRKLFGQIQLTLDSDKQRDHAEMSLNFLSNYDRRTHLPNRFKFEETLHETLSRERAAGEQIVVTAIEIRNHKQIVDNFGLQAGDSLLKMVAEKISELAMSESSIARFDENRLVTTLLFRQDSLSAQDLLDDLYKEISKSLTLENHEFFPVLCMGASLYPVDANNAKQLAQKAVSALTFCLDEKQSGVRFYSQSMLEEAKKRLEIESGLRSALAVNGFELYLQPQVDATNGRLIGAEALLRWKHESRGYISPEIFIPIAEDTGLILPLGEWVLRTASIHALHLSQRFGHVIPIGVNVSAKQFQAENFIDIVDEVLAVEGMTPDMFEIEITEGTFIEDIDRTIELLTDLKMRGLEISIDDFGTGYSSLSYLNKFPIDRLKVDRSFVVDITENEEDRLLVGLIVEMGRKLGLNVIAEGVEDDVQKDLLIAMGCHAIQGYLFSRPLPFDDFCLWVENNNAK